MRQRLGTLMLDRLDLLVELSTLGEYRLADDGRPLALGGGPASGGEAWSGPGEASSEGEASLGADPEANGWERPSDCSLATRTSALPRVRGDCSPDPQPPPPSLRRLAWPARP